MEYRVPPQKHFLLACIISVQGFLGENKPWMPWTWSYLVVDVLLSSPRWTLGCHYFVHLLRSCSFPPHKMQVEELEVPQGPMQWRDVQTVPVMLPLTICYATICHVTICHTTVCHTTVWLTTASKKAFY